MLYQHHSIEMWPSRGGYDWKVVYDDPASEDGWPTRDVDGLQGHARTQEQAKDEAREALASSLKEHADAHARTMAAVTLREGFA